MTRKVAVVGFTMGGPDSLEAVEPFLFNLFNDPAIIGAPKPIRWLLAKYISRKRGPVARDIYRHLGGSSPLLGHSRRQMEATAEGVSEGIEAKGFVAMRYWHPFASETVEAVKAFAPDEVVLVPLYPQFSTTTSASSLDDWAAAARKGRLDVPTRTVCCYPTDPGFIRAVADLVAKGIEEAKAFGRPRVLFSAHGLPKSVVAKGDPYQWQVEQSAEAVVEALEGPDPDWTVCYQSRVGPMEWIGPSTEEELARAGRDRVPVVVVPIAFVSEHSETLVELDIEYRAEAEKLGIPGYVRVSTALDHPAFIDGLAGLVRRALEGGAATCSQDGNRICPSDHTKCRQG